MVWWAEVVTVQVAVDEPASGHVVVALAGELDLAAAPAVADAVGRALSRGTVGEVVIDLAQLTFLDSSGVHALMRAREAVRAQGASFAVRRAVPAVTHVLRIAGVGELLGVPPAEQ
jgi:anti-sigma B factor antagonist